MFIALIVTSFACADPIPKAAPEPAWMANFRKIYQLKDGQYVKRVAAPYIRERIDFMVELFDKSKGPEAEQELRDYYFKQGKWLTVMIEQSEMKFRMRMILSSVALSNNPKAQRGQNLFEVSNAVEHITGMSKPEFIVDPRHAKDPLFDNDNRTVHGDFVVRRNAPIEKLAEQLEAILRNECKVPCKLRVDKVEQEVYVASGTFALTPPEWRKSSDNSRLKKLIDIYATKNALRPQFDPLVDNDWDTKIGVESSVSYGTPVDLVRFLGVRLNRRVVWDSEIPFEPTISWCDHKRLNPTPQELADDTDPAKVLKNMESQTGLTFKKEKRKVPVLVIYPSELK